MLIPILYLKGISSGDFEEALVALLGYPSKKLAPPIPTKDGGTLRTIQEACEYMAAIGEERELRRHWQHVRKQILEEADIAAVSWQLRLAILKDAKLDVSTRCS